MDSLRQRVETDMKQALRSGDKRRLGTLRLMLAAIKQKEIDGRVTLDDPGVVGVLEKMLKQRNDSLRQYRDAGRQDLAEQEAYEIEVIHGYMPERLSAEEVSALVAQAISSTGASTPRDMGAVMAALKEQLQGRADMKQVSALVRQRLQGG